MRRVRRSLGALLAVLGIGALVYAGVTVAWQDPLGALQAQGAQHRLSGQYEALVRRYDDAPQPTVEHRRGVWTRRQAVLRRASHAAQLDAATRDGRALGRLRIKRIGLSDVWVQGTDADALKLGPGHYPGTVLPGRRGTVGLAGHRTTHGAPFRHLDELRPGDPIDVSMPYGAYRYVVQRTRIVTPDRVEVLKATREDRLVLTACHPLWSAAKRIVVTARLVRAPGTAAHTPTTT